MVLRYHKTIIVALILIFLPACSGYEDYSDVTTWEPTADQAGSTVVHYYQWDNDKSSRNNYKKINKPTFFGLPEDTNLCSGDGPIQWTYLYIVGPKHAVRYENITFSNSSEVSYIVGYLPRPSKSLNNNYIDSVTVSEIEKDGDVFKVTITCKWHRSRYSALGGIRKDHYTTKLYPNVRYEITPWVADDTYIENVECIITNHSGHYNTIDMVGLPGSVHYNISVKTGNVTRYILKSSYVYFKNETVNYQLYDMYDYDFFDLYGVAPYGKDCFLLPSGYIDNISIVISSPFDSYILETNITRKEVVEDIKSGDMCTVFMCFFAVYILYRMVR